jgi:hypothetical protein
MFSRRHSNNTNMSESPSQVALAVALALAGPGTMKTRACSSDRGAPTRRKR